MGPDGVLYFPTYSCDDAVLGLAVSSDQGRTWTRRKLLETEIQDLYPPALAIDTEGNLYLGWKGPGGLPYVAVSTDRGQSFGEPLMLAAPGVGSIKRLGIVARDPGHILVSYLGSSEGGASLDAYMTESRNALDADPIFWSAAVNDPSASVLDADASETFGDRMWFLRGNIAPDGTPWAAFHCFDTELCPGERLGIAGRLERAAG